MRVRRVVPMLRIFSVDKAREFYVDYLGCAVDWEHRFAEGMPLYMQVSRGDLVFHLTEHHGDACPGSAVFIDIDGLDALAAELAARRYAYLNPAVEDAPWGARVLRLLDPFGNRLLFNEYRPEA